MASWCPHFPFRLLGWSWRLQHVWSSQSKLIFFLFTLNSTSIKLHFNFHRIKFQDSPMEFNLKLPNHLPSTFPHISLTSLQPSTLFGHKHASIAPPRRKLMFSSGTSPILFYPFLIYGSSSNLTYALNPFEENQ